MVTTTNANQGARLPGAIKPMSIDERLDLFLKGQEEIARNIEKLYETVFRLEQIIRMSGMQIEQLMNMRRQDWNNPT